jgi:hypothetical protein
VEKVAKEVYEDKKIFNVFGNNRGSKWTWYNVMDAMLSETVKANGVAGAIDKGTPVIGTTNAPVDLEGEAMPATKTK